MLEHILITILSILVVILSLSIFIRWRQTRGTILLNGKAINELICAIVENARAGRIPDIAERVSVILGNYLKCSKIAFLKLSKSTLEPNFTTGLEPDDLNRVSAVLTPEFQKMLKSISQVTDLEVLEPFLSSKTNQILKKNGFDYFFSVFLRNNLFGIYLIKTSLPRSNASLKFLTTALAFSLSAAYHIRQQEKRLKKYENRLKFSGDPGNTNKTDATIGRRDLNRYLKIKNSQELILELTKTLRKECEFNKMGIYVKSEDSNGPLIAVNWQIRDNIDKLLRENFEFILKRLNPGETYDKKSFFDIFQDAEVKFDSILDNELEYFTSIPWFDKRQAFMVWNGSASADKITGRLQDFWRGALPLVEYTSRFEKANEMSYTDGLTGVYNRRYFQQRLTEELHRARRYGRTLTLLILDVDDLKLVNDTYGHPAGDQLLKTLARVLSESVRSIDLISRYGGDEFCLIMPETGRNRARLLMNRIKSKIESSPLLLEGVADVRHYSVSIGGAVFPTDADSFNNLFLAADKALLAAKSDGRNCSRLYEPEIEFKTSNNQ